MAADRSNQRDAAARAAKVTEGRVAWRLGLFVQALSRFSDRLGRPAKIGVRDMLEKFQRPSCIQGRNITIFAPQLRFL